MAIEKLEINCKAQN